MKSFSVLYESWSFYLLPNQTYALQKGEECKISFLNDLERDFDNLVALDGLLAKLSPQELEVKNLMPREGDIAALFTYSNRIQWISFIEAKYPVLNLLVETLERSIKKKREHTIDILKLKLREQTYYNLEYNRLNNRVSYRDLQHQLNKKRRVWPLRKLLHEYSNEVFQLSPCWLASPESVSSIFPMDEIFDLVIFDEASQCFAEKGVPSLARAKQVMITGDEHQLRPNNLYHVNWDEEEDEEQPIELEKDSLLELGCYHLRQVMLTSHYRSQHFSLINFSNKNFYENKLEYIPGKGEEKNTAIFANYIRDGVWEKNSNSVEANEVVKAVVKLIESGIKSIGVITFNQKQQELIDSLLYEWSLVNQTILPSQVFVKNIENVQGDERDYILFSVGYGKTPFGKFILNFGSLNHDGGENRLNVAITRAIKEVHLFSSILPHEINSDHLKNKGAKLLKAYLTYCFEREHDKPKDYFIDYSKSLAKKIMDKNDDFYPTYFGDLTDGESVVFTDDNFYYQSKLAKDFFFYKPRRLRKKMWDVSFSFSRNIRLS